METLDLEMVRGDDESWTFEITDDSDNPQDFTGCRFDLHIQPERKGETIKLSTATGEIKVRSNLIDIIISHDKTQDVNWTVGKWDLQCTYPDDKVRTLCGGAFELTPDVTRGV